MRGSDTASPGGPCAASAANSAAANTWTHLVGTFDATSKTMSLYVNGTLAGTATDNAAWNAADSLVIGGMRLGGAASDNFAGSVSGVKAYNRALSATDVANLYSGNAGQQPQAG